MNDVALTYEEAQREAARLHRVGIGACVQRNKSETGWVVVPTHTLGA